MEKTIQVSIGGMQFQLTEAAYNNLSAYLERLKAQFLTNADGPEIIRDIEARIAEKLLETKHRLISADDITNVIKDMGDAAAFNDEADAEPDTAAASSQRKLYRNGDDAIIAGVASGLAAYFGVNVMAVRLAFLLTTLFSGASIAIYIILWIIMPEAKTASQKLEMKGAPVTLESIARVVKDRVEETRERGGFSRIVRFPADVIRALRIRVFPVLGKVLGLLLSVGAFFAFIGVSVVLGIILLNWNASWNDIPHKEFISPAILQSLLAAGYAALVIPLLFIFSLGQRWLKNRTLISSTVGFGLMGVWALSLVGCGVFGTKLIGDYVAYTQSSPEYAQTIEERPVGAFDAISIKRARVTVRSGEAFGVQVSGRKIDMENIAIIDENGLLSISAVDHDGPCLFCNHSIPSVTVTVPSLQRVEIRGASLSLEKLTLPALTIDAQGANLSGEASIASTTLNLQSSWNNLTLRSTSVAATVRNSRLELEGSADTLLIDASNGSVSAEGMPVNTASVSAHNANINVHAKQLDIQSDRNSTIENDQVETQSADPEAGASDTEKQEN